MREDLFVEPVTGKDLDNIWPICTELARCMAYPSFFCTGEWLKASAENLCEDDALFILVAKSGTLVKAVLPLVFKPNILGGRDLHLLGTDFYPDPVGLISNRKDRNECATALKDYLLKAPGWDRLILNWVLEDEMKDWSLPGRRLSVEPFMFLRPNYETILGEMKRKNRRYVRGKLRKIAEAGGELVTSGDKNSHRTFLEALLSLHRRRSIEKRIQSSFLGARVEALHRKLIEETEMVRFYGLRIDHRIVAVFYGFEFCNRLFAYQIAHDPLLRDLGPGTAVLSFAIADCCTRGVREFNFLQGSEDYKGIWTNHSRWLYRNVLTRGTWRSKLLTHIENVKGSLKNVLERMRSGAQKPAV
jgi:hypothetical protein